MCQDPSDNSSRISGSPAVLRQLSQAKVLAALRGAGTQRLSDLAGRVGLSRPTVSNALDELHESGWVAYLDGHPGGRSGLGRPARLVRFRPEAGYVLGVDIGPHRATVAVADLDGRQVASARRATSAAHTGDELLSAVRATISEVLRQARISRHSVLSVAAGSPGIVDRDAGTVTLAPGLPEWTSINLRSELRRSFRCAVHVENDVNLAVLGECAYGAARDATNVVFVLWGERVGAGICLDGQLYRGSANAAGEIGYLTVLEPRLARAEPDGQGRGPFEQAIAASTIAALGRQAAARRSSRKPALLDPGRPIEPADVFDAAVRGDPAAQEIVEQLAAQLARGLAPLLLIIDPDLLVLGGGLSRAGASVLDPLNRHLQPLTLLPPSLTLSTLADNAVALGAIRLALTDVEEHILPTTSRMISGAAGAAACG